MERILNNLLLTLVFVAIYTNKITWIKWRLATFIGSLFSSQDSASYLVILLLMWRFFSEPCPDEKLEDIQYYTQTHTWFGVSRRWQIIDWLWLEGGVNIEQSKEGRLPILLAKGGQLRRVRLECLVGRGSLGAMSWRQSTCAEPLQRKLLFRHSGVCDWG